MFVQPQGQVQQAQTVKLNALLNLELYESDARTTAVKFCGWHPNTMLRPEDNNNLKMLQRRGK